MVLITAAIFSYPAFIFSVLSEDDVIGTIELFKLCSVMKLVYFTVGSKKIGILIGTVRTVSIPEFYTTVGCCIVSHAHKAGISIIDPLPVSYTHLDVYKRQANNKIKPK